MKIFLTVFLLCTNQCFSQVNLKLGLRAYYPFSGNAKDVSGNNNNPVFNNATLTQDRFGNPDNAYHFNGKNSYIRIPNNASLNTNKKLSLCVWVRPTGFYAGKCHGNSILMKGDDGYASEGYFIWYDDNAGTNSSNCIAPVESTVENFYGFGTFTPAPGYKPYIKKNQWYSLVIIYDGSTAKMYIDCQLKYSGSQLGHKFTNTHDLFIGRLNDAAFPYWVNGDIDEVRIYDRALNKEEILALCDYKPAITKPEYVKVKEKNKVILPATKKQVDKPSTVKASLPLLTTSNQEDVKPGFIKLFNYENEQEIVLQERKKEMTREITVDSDSVSVTLYDNGEIDGDSVTLIYNDKILTTHQRLTDKPLTFWVKIAPANSRNELIMYAENLGSIPPNTALMVIYDGQKRYEVNIKSTDKTNGSVSFKLRE